jgi:hypothetical protein
MRATDLHPYCAVVVTLIPLDSQGKPDHRSVVTLSGTGGPIEIEADHAMIRWVQDRETGTRFTIAGSREWI